MVAIAVGYLGNHDDAEDITQDALIKLWAMHEMLRESEVERIAFTVLKHLCIDELRRREFRKGRQTVSIDGIDIAAESAGPREIEERERQLMIAVGKLPSRQRLLLQMRYLNGKDVHTIARITGSSEESINMALSRARNRVYRLMAVVVAVVCLAFLPMWRQTATRKVMAEAECKMPAEGGDVLPEVRLHYQQVLSESCLQITPVGDADPEFYALCAYANERTEALSRELVGKRRDDATCKMSASSKIDDL